MEAIFNVNNLSFSYPKSTKEVLSDVSFDIQEGEIFGLLGRSGAGKSTTQKILIKLLDNYKGSILYNGKDLKSFGTDFYESVGMGFEMPVHFNKLTGFENMQYFSQLYKNRADINNLLERVGLLPDKNTPVGQYSKGMKVRLNFVRALLNNPKMLFLDEVTNGLDPQNAKILKDMILEYKNNGGTVLLTTHLMNDVEELCDKVAFISNGKIEQLSTPRELKIKYGTNFVTVEYKENGNLEKAQFNLQNLGTNDEFSSFIKGKDIVTIHSGETNLSDIFIKVVKE